MERQFGDTNISWNDGRISLDGGFDNAIIAHKEYGHGWSTRLTELNSNCSNARTRRKFDGMILCW
ncbi:MAG: M36 family metallopeptidase [Cytophagaceae bacterium]|nr:M36 family metallopeptidase [Cytophagaceae bacterium]